MTTSCTVKVGLFCLALAAAPLVSHAQVSESAGAQQSPAQQAPTPANTEVVDGGSSAYVLGRDDVVEVGLLGRTDFGGRVRVQADGTILLPFIGKVQAADRTAAELSAEVREKLKAGQFFADPVVTVEIVGYASRYVTVLGAVGSPGLIPMNRRYRVSDILARVGGVRENAADYLIIRSEDGGEKRLSIRALATGAEEQDPYVNAGDKIFSPMAENFYIYGQVNAPGVYTLASGMTVRQALAKGGGLTESGSDKKVEVTRDGKKVKLKLGDEIQAGDVLVIGERLF